MEADHPFSFPRHYQIWDSSKIKEFTLRLVSSPRVKGGTASLDESMQI